MNDVDLSGMIDRINNGIATDLEIQMKTDEIVSIIRKRRQRIRDMIAGTAHLEPLDLSEKRNI